jgi:hypothetical protein
MSTDPADAPSEPESPPEHESELTVEDGPDGQVIVAYECGSVRLVGQLEKPVPVDAVEEAAESVRAEMQRIRSGWWP